MKSKFYFFPLCADSTTEIPWQDNFTKKILSFLPDKTDDHILFIFYERLHSSACNYFESFFLIPIDNFWVEKKRKYQALKNVFTIPTNLTVIRAECVICIYV